MNKQNDRSAQTHTETASTVKAILEVLEHEAPCTLKTLVRHGADSLYWASTLTDLCTMGLVSDEGNPAVYDLTEAGQAALEGCWAKSRAEGGGAAPPPLTPPGTWLLWLLHTQGLSTVWDMYPGFGEIDDPDKAKLELDRLRKQGLVTKDGGHPAVYRLTPAGQARCASIVMDGDGPLTGASA